MTKAQKSWVKNRDMPKFKIGDQVWLEGNHLHTNQPTIKLVPRRHGPFTIVQVMSPVNYHLKLPTQWSIHLVFHIDLLTPYCETSMHGPNYSISAHHWIWLMVPRNTKWRRFLTLRGLAEDTNCNIWSNGRATQTWRISGLIRMTSLLMKHYGHSKNQTPPQKCT